MITRPGTIEEYKSLFIEILLNKTNKVTKISDESILNGVGYGVAKIGQKAIKDIALVESHLFPEFAFGDHLDLIATRHGVPARFADLGSSTYIRLVGDPGTIYIAGTHKFIGNNIEFNLSDNVTIPESGYIYVLVNSTQTGSITNVPSLSINKMNNIPTGHLYVINEYKAIGGRNFESDESFRRRIINYINIEARTTLEYINQLFQSINPKILRVFYYGVNDQNQSILSIATQNGQALTSAEIDDILDRSRRYLQLDQYSPLSDNGVNIELRNIEYQFIDLDFRCSLLEDLTYEDIRKLVEIQISKYFDFRYWQPGDRVEWDDLLQIVKNVESIEYVMDDSFFPSSDIIIENGKLPRVRGLIIRDLEGNVIVDNNNYISTLFYPSSPDYSYQSVFNIT